MPDDDRLVACDTHGNVKWEDDILCAHCGRMWKADGNCPDTCTCGVKLMPNGADFTDFSARIICPACAAKKRLDPPK